MTTERLDIRVTDGGSARTVRRDIDSIGDSSKKSAVGVKTMVAALAAMAAATTVIRSSLAAYARQEQAVLQLEAALKSTGEVAGFTSKELQGMASSLQEVTTFGDEAIIEMQGLLLTFTNVRGAAFEAAQEGILNLATRLGTDLKSAALQVGKALNDPILGISALGRAGIQFGDSQKELIKTMVETGDVAGAQAVILAELETQFGGSARAAAEGTGRFIQLKNAVGDASEQLGGMIATSGILNNVLDDLLLVANLLAGNDIDKWAADASRFMRVLIFAAADLKFQFEALTTALGAAMAVMAAPFTRGVTIANVMAQFEADLVALRAERDAAQTGLVARLEGINLGLDAPGGEGREGAAGRASSVPFSIGGVTAASSKVKAARQERDELEEFVKALQMQNEELGKTESELMRLRTARAVAGRETSELAARAREYTEALIQGNEALEKSRLAEQKRAEQLSRAEAIIESTLTPLERYSRAIDELSDLFAAKMLTREQFNRGLKATTDAYEEAINKTKELSEKALQSLEEAVKGFGRQTTDALVNMTSGGKFSFRDMADSIVRDINRIIIQTQLMDPLIGSLTGSGGGEGGGLLGAFMSLFGGGSKSVAPNVLASGFDFGLAGGGVMTTGGLMPLQRYSRGGVARRPQIAMFGEGSRPEAFVPLPDGRRIPVEMQGQARGMTVINNFSVQAPRGRIDRETQAHVAQRVGQAVNRTLARDT